MRDKHLLGGHELIVGDDVPPADFNGITVSEEDFMKMQEAGVLKMVKVKDTSRKRNRNKYQNRRRRLKKVAKRSKQRNRR